jgi:hypothetical protein
MKRRSREASSFRARSSHRNLGTSVINGAAPDFAAAKAAAEAALRALQDVPAETMRKPVSAHRSAS